MSGQLLTDITNMGYLLGNGSSVSSASSTLLGTYSGASLSAVLSAQNISTANINAGFSSSVDVSASRALAIGLALGLGIPYIGAMIVAGIWYWKKYNRVADIDTPRSVSAKGGLDVPNRRLAY